MAWLIAKFVKNYQDTHSSKVRYAVCRLCGYVGIVLNLSLFLGKFLVGSFVGSVAIKGDAINNLTDAGSNIVSILSFHLAEKPADKEHPYGHERTETIASLFMGMVIVYLGLETLRQSVEKIIHPGEVDFQWSAVIVLVMAICIKLIMYTYNRKYARIYDSDLLLANAIDSRNDVLGTSLVLLSTLISPLIHYDLDGIMGVLVSGIILYAAYDLLKDVISTLVGEAPNEDTLSKLEDRILSEPIVLDVHDVILHSYGPKSVYATAHAEVDGTMDLVWVHEKIDAIERSVRQDMDIDLVIHVDPVLLHDEATIEAENLLDEILDSIDEKWSMHDFRLRQTGGEQTDVYFDLVIPYEEERSEEEILDLIQKQLPADSHYNLVIRLEHPYS